MKTVEEAKERLLALEKELDLISRAREQKISVFDAAGMMTQEIKHSAFFAWLLNPKKPHELGALFLQKFCRELLNYRINLNGNDILNRDIIEHALDGHEAMYGDSNLFVGTEQVLVNKDSRIDILIASPAAKIVIVIENKVFSDMHDDQLSRYEKEIAAHSEYKDYNKVFVYLTPFGAPPFDEHWSSFDYGKIIDIVNEIYKSLPKTNKNGRLRFLLEDYMDLVNTNILKENKELRSLCRRILREHEYAVQLLIDYTDCGEEIIAYSTEYLKKHYDDIVVFRESKLSFDFYTKTIEDFFRKNNVLLMNDNSQCYSAWSFGQWDGPSVCCHVLSKNVDEEWNVAQKKIMSAIAPEKRQGRKYFRFKKYTVLGEGSREQQFKDIRDELDIRLNSLIEIIKDFDKLLMSL